MKDGSTSDNAVEASLKEVVGHFAKVNLFIDCVIGS